MKTFDVTTEYATYKNCYFLRGNYVADNTLSLEIWSDEEGPIADITRCLDCLGRNNKNKNFSFLDMNNCPWSAKLVEELGIGKDTGISQRSGYCIYPLYEFDLDKVAEYANDRKENGNDKRKVEETDPSYERTRTHLGRCS